MKIISDWLRNAGGLVVTVSAILISTGMAALIANLTWCYFPVAFYEGEQIDPVHAMLSKVASCCLGLGALTGILALIQLRISAPKEADTDYSKKMFGRCLVGIGFVLLLDALINVIAVAGFAKAGAVPFLFRPGSTNLVHVPSSLPAPPTTNAQKPFAVSGTNWDHPIASPTSSSLVSTSAPAGEAPSVKVEETESGRWMKLNTKQKNLIAALQLLFALGFTIMGALFFFAKSLWEKMKADPPLQFDERVFWAGLWFRLGEAVVFTLVIFVAMLFNRQTEASGWMPFIALIIGLSVKTAENLIAGISKRLLDAINAFIGSS